MFVCFFILAAVKREEAPEGETKPIIEFLKN